MDFIPDESAINTEAIEASLRLNRRLLAVACRRLAFVLPLCAALRARGLAGARAAGLNITAPSIQLCIALQVDKDTMDMLRGMNMAGLPGVSVAQVRPPVPGTACAQGALQGAARPAMHGAAQRGAQRERQAWHSPVRRHTPCGGTRQCMRMRSRTPAAANSWVPSVPPAPPAR